MFYPNIQPQVLVEFLKEQTYSTLTQLLLHHTGENDFLDFKLKWIDFTKLAKHILAIANSGGGCIIVGVSPKPDGTLSLDGLSDDDFLDKADIDNKLESLLPTWLKHHTEDFIYSNTSVDFLRCKKFQVLIIEYDPKYVPYTSIITKGELRYGAIYVRQGTKTVEATNDKLVDMIIRKVQSGGSSPNGLSLQEHFNQLKLLYHELNKQNCEDYQSVIVEMIELKRKRIHQLLDIDWNQGKI